MDCWAGPSILRIVRRGAERCARPRGAIGARKRRGAESIGKLCSAHGLRDFREFLVFTVQSCSGGMRRRRCEANLGSRFLKPFL